MNLDMDMKNFYALYPALLQAVESGEITADDRQKALVKMCGYMHGRLMVTDRLIAETRPLCELTPAEKSALREGCTDRLRPKIHPKRALSRLRP